ncbi:NAD(P)/FAD-dependent oxidoreductase [Streptomyces sp. NPDC048172]|uniref:NAD(P)/FAD-dependent oxidoreductase n=1 Tax=Streptomyces sp. NPDC048172 TaxID=3365505 RepID=UPI003721CCF6
MNAHATVAVVGGGYGGVSVAKALDDVADVVLVDASDTFVHNTAALRALAVPEWTERIFLPYDRLLARGTVRHDRAVHVDADAVTLASGERITADWTVLATGSAYPLPAKFGLNDSAWAKDRLHALRAALSDTERVLLLGAGPVGLELAGEIRAAWPGKEITLVDPGEELLPAFPEEFRAAVRAELDALGITVLLGTGLAELPPSSPGEAKTFTATTRDGRRVEADIWFRCHGAAPVTDYLSEEVAATARRPSGHLDVTPELRLAGQDRIFALGDVTALPEGKTAKAASAHAEVIAANIRTLVSGGGPLTSYTPAGPAIVLPLGPERGASYAPEMGVLDAATTSEIKGRAMMLDRFTELLGRA